MKPKQKNTVGFIVLGLIVYLLLILAVAHYCALAAANPEMNFLDALDALPMHMLLHPFTMVFDIKVIAIVTGVAAFIALYIATEVQVNQHDFAGAEHGSAKWNTDYKGYSKQYSSPFGKASNDGKDNMIMSQHVFLSMNSYKTQINNNVLVIGGSGSGKSRFIIKPNLLQANCSFVCTDPKGELVEACGDVLEKDGYRVVVFNLCDFEASNHYNPFAYVHSDDDIFKLVDCFWRNTTPSGSSKGDPFWDFSAQALLNAVCLYLYHATPKEDQNFTNVIRLLQLCKIDESKSDYKSVLDFMFDQFEQKCMDAAEDCGEPYVEDMAVGQYKIFRSAGQGKTAMSILITCQTRLRHFLSPKMKKFMGTDDIHLDEIGVNTPYLLTPVDIIAGCRDALKCDVEYTEDKTSRLVQYDVVAKKLIIATKEESVIAKECVNLLCLKAAEARTGRNDKLYLRLVAECAAEVVCRVNQIKTGDEIKCLELWNKDKNPEQCLEMLNQVSLASRNVLSQLRQATNHPVLLDFDETCLLNQVLDQPNATIVRHRLSRLAKHTSVPILVEAIRSLQSKLMYFEASSQVSKVYKDRLDHKIMTQPVYRI